MKKLNTRGVTLAELIIAISILGVVLSIGYGIINGANKSLNEQSKIFSGQMSINIVRDFITKDLEQAERQDSISKLSLIDKNRAPLDDSKLQALVNKVNESNKEEYIYEINTKDGKVEYKIRLSKDEKHNKYMYDVVRVKTSDLNTDTIEVLSKQPVNFNGGNVEIPFTIEIKGNSYYVELGYEQNNKQNVYKFSVSSRYV
jgi:type IV pilus assembly protein PilA